MNPQVEGLKGPQAPFDVFHIGNLIVCALVWQCQCCKRWHIRHIGSALESTVHVSTTPEGALPLSD